jgi:hypothetical protein
MHEQRGRREAVIVMIEVDRMLAALRYFGQKFAKAIEHDAASR